MEKAQVDQVRIASLDCRFDGGGLPFYWLTAVPAAESVNWLKAQVAGRHAGSAIFALSQSKDPAGMAAVIDAAKNNPDPAVRKKAMFWLGQSKDPRALDFFAQVLKP
jgi:HEAT repeat protein